MVVLSWWVGYSLAAHTDSHFCPVPHAPGLDDEKQKVILAKLWPPEPATLQAPSPFPLFVLGLHFHYSL